MRGAFRAGVTPRPFLAQLPAGEDHTTKNGESRFCSLVGMANGWTFVSNHGHVLVALATDPDALLREVAARVGITERAVQLIVADLESSGYLTRERVGRRNRYAVREDLPFRHPLEAGVPVGAFLELVRGSVWPPLPVTWAGRHGASGPGADDPLTIRSPGLAAWVRGGRRR